MNIYVKLQFLGVYRLRNLIIPELNEWIKKSNDDEEPAIKQKTNGQVQHKEPSQEKQQGPEAPAGHDNKLEIQQPKINQDGTEKLKQPESKETSEKNF